MIPKLFSATATTFSTQGIGALTDTVLCVVDEERNGKYEGYLRYPITGVHYKEIALRSIIVAKPNFTDDPQPFRVYEITKPLNGIVTVYFRHISYDLSGYPVEPFTATTLSAALSGLVMNCPVPCPFTLTTTRSVTATFKADVPASIRSWFGGKSGSLLDVYGGEWSYDGYTARLETSRGANRGVTIRYGKNLTSLEQDENCAAVYTGVYPFWTDSYGENLVQITGRIVNNTETQKYAGATYDYTKILALDLSDRWDSAPTEAQLRSAAISYIETNEIGTPKVNLAVEFVQISKLVKDRVDLCDTVTVQFERLGVEATAKCIKTRWNVLLDRYDEIVLGDARTTLADTIVQTKESAETAVNKSALERAVDQATAAITGQNGGFFVENDTNDDGKTDELLFLDTLDIATALNVWRWNLGGLGFSSGGYDGTYRTAIYDGHIVADFVNVGTLTADVIKAGSLESLNFVPGSQGFSLNLVTGETYIKALSEYGWNQQEGVLQTYAGEDLLTYAGETIRAFSPATYTQIQNNANEIQLLAGDAAHMQAELSLVPGQITAAVSALEGAVQASLALEITTDSQNRPYGKISANADYIEFDTGDLIINSNQFSLDASGNATFSGIITASQVRTGSMISTNGMATVDLDNAQIYVTDSLYRRAMLRGDAGSLILSYSTDNGATYTEIGSLWVSNTTGRSVANIDTIQVGRYQAAPTTQLRANQVIAEWNYSDNEGYLNANRIRIRKTDGSALYPVLIWDSTESTPGTKLTTDYAEVTKITGQSYWGSNGEVIHYTATGGNVLRAISFQAGTESTNQTAISWDATNSMIDVRAGIFKLRNGSTLYSVLSWDATQTTPGTKISTSYGSITNLTSTNITGTKYIGNSYWGSNGEVLHFTSSGGNNVVRAYQYQIGNEASHAAVISTSTSGAIFSGFQFNATGNYSLIVGNVSKTIAGIMSNNTTYVSADELWQSGQSLANVLIAD